MTSNYKYLKSLKPYGSLLGVTGASAYVLSFFAPWYWVFDLLNHFLFYYLGALSLSALLLGLAGEKNRTLLVAVFVVVCAFDLFRGQTLPQRIEHASQLRMVHFNVNSANKNRRQILQELLRPELDLVVLLETGPEWKTEFQALPKPWRLEAFVPETDNFGIALLSRIPLSKTRVVSLGPFSLATIETEIELEGLTVLLLGVHAAPPINGEYAAARDAQLEKISQIVTTSSRAAIVAGDFNATPWSHSLRALQASTGLNNAYKVYSPTWPDGGMIQIPIDLSLYSKSLVVTERRIGEAMGSDHKPVYVSFARSGVLDE